MMKTLPRALGVITTLCLTLFSLLGCQSTQVSRDQPEQTAPTYVCEAPTDPDLFIAISQAKQDLSNSCKSDFYRYFQALLVIAEQQPDQKNKQIFSDFLVWSKQQRVISQAMASDLYNRYFNIKFMSLTGDFSNCSSTCKQLPSVLTAMQQELQDKEQGLLKVSRENERYQRAYQLMHEAELVLSATCTACRADRTN